MPSDSDSPDHAAPRRRGVLRALPLVALVAVAALALAFGAHRYLSVEALVDHRAQLEAWVAARPVAALLAYVLAYVAVVALSLPGGTLMTLLGGFLFGVAVGAPAAVIGATVGATILFVAARTSLGDTLARRAGPWVARLARGFRHDAFSYLLFLRLVPAFPFWLVNLVPALLGMRTVPYVGATALGVVPSTVVFAVVGDGLGGVLDQQAASLAACRGADQAVCATLSVADLMTTQIVAGLAALGVLALLPALVRRLRRGAPGLV